MRILVLENALTSTRGGQELSLLDVTRGLAGRGHEIALAYVASGDLEPEYRTFCAQMIPVGSYAIDRAHMVGSIADFVSSLCAVRATRPDAVYANQYLDSLFAAVVSRLRGVPFVCHLRLPPPDTLCGQFRIGMSQAARFIATSEQTRRDWAALGYPAARIAVVPNGIDVGRFTRRASRGAVLERLGAPRGRAVVLYAGRLHPAKGVETLLDAFRTVARARDAHLILSGAPATMRDANGGERRYGDELRLRTTGLGIADRVSWVDHWADMPALFSAADVAVLPSLWSEPFGRVVIEAMACETPVVASRVGGIPEVLTGEFERWLVPPGDDAALAACLLETLAAAAADPGLGRRAREHVARHFGLEAMIAGVERELIEARDCHRTGDAAIAVQLQ